MDWWMDGCFVANFIVIKICVVLYTLHITSLKCEIVLRCLNLNFSYIKTIVTRFPLFFSVQFDRGLK